VISKSRAGHGHSRTITIHCGQFAAAYWKVADFLAANDRGAAGLFHRPGGRYADKMPRSAVGSAGIAVTAAHG
jgi:hypothetical protein